MASAAAPISTTSLDALPVAPQTLSPSTPPQAVVQAPNINMPMENIVLSQPPPTSLPPSEPSAIGNNSSDYQQMLTHLQQAGTMGLTNLPSRDIPQQTTGFTQDQQMRPNFIPDQGQAIPDYIRMQELQMQRMAPLPATTANAKTRPEEWYDELQVPILLAVLYFIFQLPSVHKYMFSMLPSLFDAHGHPNLVGYVVNSMAFAGLYYVLTKVKSYLVTV